MNLLTMIKKYSKSPEFFIIVANGLVAIGGFIFWALVYRKSDFFTIGVASNIIAIGMLVGYWARFGAEQAILKVSGDGKLISKKTWSYIIVFIIFSTFLGVTIMNSFSSIPAFLTIFLSLGLILNIIIDSLFLIRNQTHFILLKGAFLATGRITTGLLFSFNSGQDIVLAWISPIFVVIPICILYIIYFTDKTSRNQLKDGNKDYLGLSEFFNYSIVIFVVSGIAALPTQFLPTLINEGLGEVSLGRFQGVWLLLQLILTASLAFKNVLLGNPFNLSLKERVIRSVKLQIVFLVLAIMFLLIGAPILIRLIIGTYDREMIMLLRIFGFLLIPMSIISITQATFYSNNNFKIMILTNTVSSSFLLTGFVILTQILRSSLLIIALYWMSITSIFAIIYIVIIKNLALNE